MALSKDIFQKVLKIIKIHNFVRDVVKQAENKNITVYNYGSPGSLMRHNILEEWLSSTIFKQENSYLVQNSQFGNEDSSKRNENIFHHLRNSLVEGCREQYKILIQNGRKLPLVIGSVGTVFCDSISDDTFLLNGHERTQMTVTHFCSQSSATQSFDFWQQYRLQWWRQLSAQPVNYSISGANKADNCQLQADITYQFPWGQEVIESIINHGSYGNQENKNSKSAQSHLIECSTDLERCLLIFLFDSFIERSKPSKVGTSKQMRQFLQLHTHLAPYKVSVLVAGSRLNELKAVGRKVQNDFRKEGIVLLDNQFQSFTASDQVMRNDQLGIPYTVILKDQTLENGITLLRNRDTTIKQEIHISRLTETLKRNIRPSNHWTGEKKATAKK